MDGVEEDFNEVELTNRKQGSEQNAVEKRRWGGQGWNKAVAPIRT